VLEEVYDNVDGFVIEVKAKFDDIDGIMELTDLSRDKSEQYLQDLTRFIDIVKDKWLRIWVRVIPDYINTGTIPDG
jgi:pyruvate formate lyase activating enzyme